MFIPAEAHEKLVVLRYNGVLSSCQPIHTPRYG
jgi:hypothetical protein